MGKTSRVELVYGAGQVLLPSHSGTLLSEGIQAALPLERFCQREGRHKRFLEVRLLGFGLVLLQWEG
jgi:hypothetical protein